MSHGLRLLLLPVLLMLAGAERAARPVLPEGTQGKIEISANSLRIQPGLKTNFLRFGGGVSISGQGFSLSAQTVEIDVSTEGVLDTTNLKLPEIEAPPDRVIADPAAAVQQMARDIRGPTANLDAASLKRIAASGDVRISGPGMSLTTSTIYSTDGGLSWGTAGTARLEVSDRRRGQQGSFSAELISFNTQTETLLARGSLQGSFKQGQQPAVSLRAGELRADLKANSLELHGGLKLGYGDYSLELRESSGPDGSLKLQTDSMELVVDGSFELHDGTEGLKLSGSGLTGSLGSGGKLAVRGGIELTDSDRGLAVKAQRLSAVLEPLRVEVRGAVRLSHGKSSYEAEEAIISREGSGRDAKYILEMSGPQRGSIDLNELREAAGDAN